MESQTSNSKVETKTQLLNSGQSVALPSGDKSEPYAGFIVRWAANIIDGLIIWLIIMAVSLVVGIFLGTVGLSSYERLLASVGRLIGLVVSFGYFIFLTYKQESTWGKSFFGLKVVDSEHKPMTLLQVALRETVGKFLSAFILGLGYLMVIFSKKKQALHDKIASTYVVYKDSTVKPKKMLAIIVVMVNVVVLFGLLAIITLVSLNSARQKALDKSQDVLQQTETKL